MAHLARLTAWLSPRTVVDRVRRWPVESQHVSRRNAMLAGTALAALRAEREVVADLLRPPTSPAPRPAVPTQQAQPARQARRR